MLRTLRCTKCGNHTVATSAKTLAQRILCATCGHEIPLTPTPNHFGREGMMRMGDDEGGGDWGGGGGDDSEEDEDDDDDDESGGKKKKKKKKGFFAGLIAKVISAVVGFTILGTLCCCFFIYKSFFPDHPLVGEWQNVSAMAKAPPKDDKEKKENGDKKDDKDKKDDAQKKDEKLEDEPRDVVYTLTFVKGSDDKAGTGTYKVDGPAEADSKTLTFKWKDFDKEKKTLTLELDKADEKFWKDIKSPANFTFAIAGKDLTLTSGADSLVFTKVEPVKDEPKGGGGKKRRR